MNTKLATLVPLVLLLATSASPALTEGEPGVAQADVPRAVASPADAREAGEALEAFGLDLYRALAPGRTNMVFSPTSIALALAMARAGARGQTAAEMDAVVDAGSVIGQNFDWQPGNSVITDFYVRTYPDPQGAIRLETLESAAHGDA